MSGFPGRAKSVRGGFVLVDPDTGQPVKTIPFQFNPDTLTRTLQPQGIGSEPGDRLEALRLKGPPHETMKFEAEFDAADAADKHPDGLHPVLAALELSMYPNVAQLREEDAQAGRGTLEIAPVEAPLTVLVLGPKRVVPVRIADFSVTEEAFDQALAPIRAKVSIGVRVLTVDDLGYRHKGGLLYLAHQSQKERFAHPVDSALGTLGVSSI
ncbi:hypothetical protein NDR87_22870 [Nocardia sp. CDC159]|uniref:Uncharacterized protein n=1 Tax=Nocardia pulmonis TaxID=2951408 RepID=A0A9X2J160_9NOCA|nr:MULTISPECIES: hypothetical protein [Nocardia]MCM6776636.1 hypothetical protein [Nocardia pulmonis]MCM6789215.1 hypothetical protein [Nocardia sp. CDC159]